VKCYIVVASCQALFFISIIWHVIFDKDVVLQIKDNVLNNMIYDVLTTVPDLLLLSSRVPNPAFSNSLKATMAPLL